MTEGQQEQRILPQRGTPFNPRALIVHEEELPPQSMVLPNVRSWDNRDKLTDSSDSMTISNKERNQAMNTALRRMLDALGEQWIGVTRFEVASDDFSDLPQTTWLELKEEMWVRPAHDSSGHAFKLTGRGLIEAMKRSGGLDSAEHKERCVVLKTAFKDLIKGRELSGGSTDTWSLVAQTKLTDTWIWNALDARFLVQQWPDEYVDVEVRSGGRDIRVPANFGMKRPWGMEAGPLAPIPEGD